MKIKTWPKQTFTKTLKATSMKKFYLPRLQQKKVHKNIKTISTTWTKNQSTFRPLTVNYVQYKKTIYNLTTYNPML